MKNNNAIELPSAEYLNTILRCDYDTGVVYWKERPREDFKNQKLYSYFINNTLPNPAGTNKGDGYLIIWLDGKLYRLHRIIWKMYYGEDPKHFIDHINGDRSDNRIVNLRDATHSENNRNRAKISDKNTTGYTGIIYCEARNKYRTVIMYNNKTIHIGEFEDINEARVRRVMLEKALYKEFYAKTDDIEDTEYYKNYIDNLTEEQIKEYTRYKEPKKYQLAKTGYVGVEYVGENSYSARFSYNKIRYYLGTFNTPEEAALARENKLKELKSLNTTET